MNVRHRWTAVLLAASALVSPALASEELRYDGATTIGSRIIKEAAPAFEKKTGTRFALIGTSGAGKGLKAALAGEVTIGGVSRSLTPEELAARPYFQIVGYDALGIFVNEKNPVKVLTKAQLKGIYTGKIVNWKEVGGGNLPIVACSEPLTSGRATVDVFKGAILVGAEYGKVLEQDDATDCLKVVARDPGAIAPASMGYAVSGTRALPVDGIKPTGDEIRSGAYPLSRPLILVSKARPTGAAKQFYDFVLSPEGQQIVARSFISVR